MAKRRLWRSQRRPPRRMSPAATTCLYPSRHPSAVRTDRACSVCRPTPVLAGPPIFPVQAPSHHIIATTRVLHGPYCTKDHDQCEWNHQGGPRRCPDPLPGHCPGRLLPRRTSIITQRPSERRWVAWFTGALWYRPCNPSAHQYCHPWPCQTVSRHERQNKFKLCTTNGRSKCVTHNARRPRRWRQICGKY